MRCFRHIPLQSTAAWHAGCVGATEEDTGICPVEESEGEIAAV